MFLNVLGILVNFELNLATAMPKSPSRLPTFVNVLGLGACLGLLYTTMNCAESGGLKG